MMRHLSRWFYFFPGNVYAYGPTTDWYGSEKAAREAIREAWQLKRLPRGFSLWRA